MGERGRREIDLYIDIKRVNSAGGLDGLHGVKSLLGSQVCLCIYVCIYALFVDLSISIYIYVCVCIYRCVYVVYVSS